MRQSTFWPGSRRRGGNFFVLPLALAWSLQILSGCRVDTNAAMVEIQRAVAPDPTCIFAPTNATAAVGVYDPLVDPKGFKLVLLLRNNLQARTDNPELLDQSVNVRNRVNDVSVVGFEGCWAQFSGDVTAYGTYTNSSLLDCTKLPNQSGSIVASGQADEGGLGTTLAYVDILTPTHLKQIFGSAFDAVNLPRTGPYSAVGFDNKAQNYYSLTPTPPDNVATRAKQWGQNYPASVLAPVVVQLRAVLTTQSGDVIRSGWFSYLIKVCPGCVDNSCGDLVQKICPTGVCTDGSACLNGSCTVGGLTTPCPTSPQFSGNLPAYPGTVCLPAQGYSSPDCTSHKVGC
jgi:hypothetical protein